MSTVINVENLGKKYIVAHQQREEYSSLRDVLTNSMSSLGKRLVAPFKRPAPGTRTLAPEVEDFWALKDVSFEVRQGDRIGIIGRNGAGKSTLLKILSRITEPTTGSIRIKGRVASLLEVGTGFHPELTGRENIYLNGAILGMGRQEILRKFDEIVDFSEIEKFLDTPVKRYSSGMYVRLAFAVAAHLEPDILIVDEVLAVGDAEFQKKCLGKMEDVGKKGRTVLFVSHNMDAVSTLCPRSIMLTNGLLTDVGLTSEIIGKYLLGDLKTNYDCDFSDQHIEDSFAILLRTRLIDHADSLIQTIRVDQEFGIEITYQIKESGKGYRPGPNFLISTERGVKVFQSLETDTERFRIPGLYKSVAWIPANLLNNSTYILTVALTTHNPVLIHCQTEMIFNVEDNLNAITRGDYKLEMHGVVRPYINWESGIV